MAELNPTLDTSLKVSYITGRKGYLRRRSVNVLMLVLTAIVTLLALVPLFWIIGYVMLKGGQYINLDLFTQLPRPASIAGGGVLHAIEGTLMLTLVAAVIAIPIGLLAAFYAAYHPNTPLGVGLRFGTDVLSGVPSIVVGIFAYALVVKPSGHYSLLAGGIAMAIIMLPTTIRTTEEMIKLVPTNLREGALALGAPEWKTALQVTFPAALSGILTGFMLSLARASGETAPLLFTALGNDRFDLGKLISGGIGAGQSVFTILGNILQQPADSLALTLFKYSQDPNINRVNQSWAVAFVLMLLVLIINVLARGWVEYRAAKLRH
ncbi:phosphate ABC transporter permease PstA [bacterium]|nr:phosphate ABC transporter permease PstA [bacterium]